MNNEDSEKVLLSHKKLVWVRGKKILTSSLKVADVFGIPADNVFVQLRI